MQPQLGFIGAGRAGATLAAALQRVGYDVKGVSNGKQASTWQMADWLGVTAYMDAADLVAECDAVFIGVPDGAIVRVCNELSQRGVWRYQQIVAHLSGAHDRQLLDSARAAGALTMSFHPLCAFARPDNNRSLRDIHFAVEGDQAAVQVAQAMVSAMGGELLTIPPGGKVLYHVAAVIASNYLVGLAHLSTEILAEIGIERQRGLAALLPLIKGTVENLCEVGLPAALTGPLARGDADTVVGHLQGLAAVEDGDYQQLYCALGTYTTRIAEERGLSRETAMILRQLLDREERIES